MKTGLDVLENLVSLTVSGVKRVMFEYQGEVDQLSGPVEFSFDDGSNVVFDAGPDGEALSAVSGVWVDPFAGELSLENQEFVRLSGKWTSFVVTDSELLGRAAGQKVLTAEPLFRGEKVVGCRIGLETLEVIVKANFDELLVRCFELQG